MQSTHLFVPILRLTSLELMSWHTTKSFVLTHHNIIWRASISIAVKKSASPVCTREYLTEAQEIVQVHVSVFSPERCTNATNRRWICWKKFNQSPSASDFACWWRGSFSCFDLHTEHIQVRLKFTLSTFLSFEISWIKLQKILRSFTTPVRHHCCTCYFCSNNL